MTQLTEVNEVMATYNMILETVEKSGIWGRFEVMEITTSGRQFVFTKDKFWEARLWIWLVRNKNV